MPWSWHLTILRSSIKSSNWKFLSICVFFVFHFDSMRFYCTSRREFAGVWNSESGRIAVVGTVSGFIYCIYWNHIPLHKKMVWRCGIANVCTTCNVAVLVNVLLFSKQKTHFISLIHFKIELTLSYLSIFWVPINLTYECVVTRRIHCVFYHYFYLSCSLFEFQMEMIFQIVEWFRYRWYVAHHHTKSLKWFPILLIFDQIERINRYSPMNIGEQFIFLVLSSITHLTYTFCYTVANSHS